MKIYKKIRERTADIKKYGFLTVLRATTYNHANKFFIFIMKTIYASRPLKNTIMMESHNDFDSNGGAFYDYLIKNHYNEKYRIVWIIKNTPPENLPENVVCFDEVRPDIRKAYYICTSKYRIFDNHTIQKVRPDQVSVYLTHGSFGLKNFKGNIGLPPNLDYCLCPSQYVAPILADQFMISSPEKVQIILGYPTHDIFYSNEPGDLKKITDHEFKKVILWMPTFRKHRMHIRNDSKGNLPLGIPVFYNMNELQSLNEILRRHNSLLIIKIHPKQELESTLVESLSNIMVLNGITVKKYGIDNYRLMKDTDALISDYSTAAYDYLHAGKPVAYSMDDVNDYKLGLVVEDPAKWVGGPIIYNRDDFLKFILSVLNGEDEYKQQREELFDKIFKYHDGNSSKRLAEFIGL